MRSAERSCEGQTDTPQSSRPDAEKIKKDVCGDVEEEFRKKKKKLPRSLQLWINIWNQEFFCAYHENMIVCLHLIELDFGLQKNELFYFKFTKHFFVCR